MKKAFSVVLVLAFAAASASPASAQERQRGPRGGGGGFGGGQLGLLSQKSVQDELKLSEDQIKQATQLSEKQREAFRGARDLSQEERQKKFADMVAANDKALAEILKPDQLKRLKQISLQLRGTMAIADPETVAALKLTDEQKEKVKTIAEDFRKEAGNRAGGGDREEARKRRAEARKTAEDQLMAVLTDEQKTKWKELAGEPFKGEIRRPGPQGGDRPARGARPPRGAPPAPPSGGGQ
jgi:Spy/CpxP family protein refolding chaperone